MKDNNCKNQSTATEGRVKLMPYSSPKLTKYGGITELTQANGTAPPTDSETTVSGPLSA